MRTILSCGLVLTMSVLSCSLCLAEDFPKDTNEIKSLTAEQAAKLVAIEPGWLELDGLTSINKDVAQELAKLKGDWLSLNGLKSNPKIQLPKKYRDKKD